MRTGRFIRRPIVWILPSLLVINIVVKQGLRTQTAAKDASAINVEGHLSRRVLSAEENATDDQEPSPCIPASIDEFPADFLTQEQRRRGGVVIHFFIVCYLCGVLAYICDDYFVPSLEIIADFLKVPSDVAGATFMAVGTSAPELFSSVIGSFITEGDIGVGTIVGSAVFNLLGVTGVVGVAVWKNEVHVDWFPITRDCTVYAITVIALIGVISNNIVEWYEAFVLLLLFLAYVVLMFFNARIEHLSILQVREEWALRLAAYQAQDLDSAARSELCPWRDCRAQLYHVHSVRSKAHRLKEKWFGNNNALQKSHHPVPNEESPLLGSYQAPPPVSRSHSSRSLVHSDEEITEEDSFWTCPSRSPARRFLWALFWPARLLIRLTVPDSRQQRWQRWSALTFLLSVAWIGALSYVAVWMVSIIGYTLGIPDSVSGITILAAGTSIPEIISSVIVARNGLGNMAICGLLGSNIFDILFCLGFPWLIKTALTPPSHTLVIHSGALTYTTVTLLSTVLLTYLTFVAARWTLNYKLGIACIVMYVVFIVVACLYELNVFGEFNPPPC